MHEGHTQDHDPKTEQMNQTQLRAREARARGGENHVMQKGQSNSDELRDSVVEVHQCATMRVANDDVGRRKKEKVLQGVQQMTQEKQKIENHKKSNEKREVEVNITWPPFHKEEWCFLCVVCTE
jgi:hypothetical protein